jgi:ABC-2 type transport system ATP-binding protein
VISSSCLAELSSVHKRYGRTLALDGLDLQVRPRELLAMLGANGAGKTTAISLMLGLAQPNQGSVLLFGQSPHRIESRRRIGVMMQEVFLAQELRVEEHIDLIASYYPSPMTTAEVLEITQTKSLAKRRYGQLSGGQKRQAQFAMALCGNPDLLFLDEPTVGLDVESRELMWRVLRDLINNGCSIVLTTHYLEEAEALADRVVVLANGHTIACGTVDEIRAHVVRKHVKCYTSVSVHQVTAWPEVESVTGEQQRLHIVTEDSDAVIRRLMFADSTCRDIEVRRAGLAEAFTELVQGDKL